MNWEQKSLKGLNPETLNQKKWNVISAQYKLSETFIEKYSDKVDWNTVCIYQKLSSSFLDRHSDKINFKAVSYSQNLEPFFLKKYADRLDWFYLSRYQGLNTKLILDNKHRITADIVMNKKLLPHAVRNPEVFKFLSGKYLKLKGIADFSEYMEKHVNTLDIKNISNILKYTEYNLFEVLSSLKGSKPEKNILKILNSEEKWKEYFRGKIKPESRFKLLSLFEKLKENGYNKITDKICLILNRIQTKNIDKTKDI